MKYICPILFIVFLVSCMNKPTKAKIDCFSDQAAPKTYASGNSNQNLNISFLLDLSDRINPKKYPDETMNFYERDAFYIKSAAEAFTIHLRTNKVIKMDDRIQLFFDPEPKSKDISTFSKRLKFHVDKTTITNELLCKIDSVYTSLPIKIYKQAISDNNYVGSNTWGFFKNNIKDYCMDDTSRNILIILTDGYIYHKNTLIQDNNLTSYLIPQYIKAKKLNSKKWKVKIKEEAFGFIPVTDNLSNLEILVLGINPDKKNPYEEDIIKTYWSNWLTTMNVKRFKIKNTDLPSNMDKIIKDFILLKS
mgnify:CR=1 FL=1